MSTVTNRMMIVASVLVATVAVGASPAFAAPDDEPVPCVSGADAPAGMVCRDGVVVVDCVTDADLPEGETCEVAPTTAPPTTAAPEPAACVSDADVPDGMVCRDGVASWPCVSDADLPEGETCEPTATTPTPEPPAEPSPCVSDADVPDGQVCVGGFLESVAPAVAAPVGVVAQPAELPATGASLWLSAVALMLVAAGAGVTLVSRLPGDHDDDARGAVATDA